MNIETKPRDTSAEETTEFTYADHAIKRRGDLLNLTSMWVATGRPPNIKPAHWLQFPETKILFDQFREELSHLPSNEKVRATYLLGPDPKTWIIKNPGRAGGTWLYWDLAITYARHLSPAFHLWTNRIVRPHMERFGGPGYDTVEGNPPWAATDKRLTKLIEREFGSLHLKLDRQHQSDGDILYLLRSMPDIAHNKRREFGKLAKELMIKVLSMEAYNGVCPCCGVNAVLDRDYKRSKGSEFDHWYDKALNLPIDGWLICHPCHSEITDDHVAARARAPAFYRFQAAVVACKQVHNLLTAYPK